ncbi:SRPBCC family protein [Actinoalloteichus fjordicus]|uniref:Polyketide cyclase / dehydrase and lipid transport n=1 Tax=Actinoalloteichus fjordicus TaxID=1612552 RepID=A0AAC9L8R9_9PSEU|nr:SRPBCC family protein [Actinoalloteichus fjordicus]APU12976.1 Polyketide cyclase / dehydrase and lipid transport [Actinoalloteichus fjordicus]
MSTADVALRVLVPTRAEKAWAAATDWARQGEWMLGTEVDVVGGDGASVGSTLAAFTGFGGVGFMDRMEITEWDPPRAVGVRHTGRLVRGEGGFRILPHAGIDRCTFLWEERLTLPLGGVGGLGWAILRPGFEWGLRRSLASFARFCRDYPN